MIASVTPSAYRSASSDSTSPPLEVFADSVDELVAAVAGTVVVGALDDAGQFGRQLTRDVLGLAAGQGLAERLDDGLARDLRALDRVEVTRLLYEFVKFVFLHRWTFGGDRCRYLDLRCKAASGPPRLGERRLEFVRKL